MGFEDRCHFASKVAAVFFSQSFACPLESLARLRQVYFCEARQAQKNAFTLLRALFMPCCETGEAGGTQKGNGIVEGDIG